MPDAPVIAPMSPEDWPAVKAIYAAGLATGNASFETEVPAWDEWNARRLPHTRLVARVGGRVAGWAALSPVSPRACYAGVAEVSIYVDAAASRRGIGRALLEAAIASSEREGIWTLTGSTFPENTASLHLQASCGFRVVGRRERVARLDGVWRDTILTERRSKSVGNE